VSSPKNLEHKLLFRLDTEALALSYYCVLDFNYKLVYEFETIEDAQNFIAEANGSTIETVKGDAEEQSKMLHEYRNNLITSMKAKALNENKLKKIDTCTQKTALGTNRNPTSHTSSGWTWDGLPDEIKQRFPLPHRD